MGQRPCFIVFSSKKKKKRCVVAAAEPQQQQQPPPKNAEEIALSFGFGRENFTTKAKEAIRRAHELAIERGQNHVNPLHLLTALVLQEESVVSSILDRLEIDIILFTDSILEAIESTSTSTTLSPSNQIYLTPDLAQILELSGKEAKDLKDDFISTEHLF